MRVWAAWLTASGLLVLVGAFFSVRHVNPANDQGPVPAAQILHDSGSNEMHARSPSSGYDNAVAPPDTKAANPFALTFTNGFLPFMRNGQPAQEWAEFHHAEVGDVTGDGRDDLISLGQTEDPTAPWMLYVYPQLPNGNLGPPNRYEVDGYDTIIGLSLADMNNDRTQDVVMTHSQGISLGLSGSDGLLRIVGLSSTIADNKDASVAAVTLDLDRDGNQDVVTHLSVRYGYEYDRSVDRRSRFRVVYGDGKGASQRSEDFGIFGVLYEPGTPYEAFDAEMATSLVAGDLDGDGETDLAMASRRANFGEQLNPPFISLYFNDRMGRFRAPRLIKANIGYGADLTVLEHLGIGDFNGDGRNDLVATPYENGAKIWVFLQTQAGVINEAANYNRNTLDIPVSLDGVDLDTDGRDDLLLGHSGWGAIGYHLQKGGSLLGEVVVGLSGFAGWQVDGSISKTGVATGDLNSDGCTDVAVAARYNGLQVFRGSNCVKAISSGACQLQRIGNPIASYGSRISTSPVAPSATGARLYLHGLQDARTPTVSRR